MAAEPSDIISETYQPEAAANLRDATARVLKEIAVGQPADGGQADEAAKAVLAVARSGYALGPGREIDADDLAEAAIARVRSSRS